MMKSTMAVLSMCLVVFFASPIWAQNGPGPNNERRTRGTNCVQFSAFQAFQELSVEEAAKLSFMREEEKLALDVYQALYEKWQVRIFKNIAASEKRHFDAIGNLISRYGLEDPAQPYSGAFSNFDLQTLYAELIARGMTSLQDALQVGVMIEEKDIADLKDAMSITDNTDILRVYGNLLNGSLTHLLAFNSHLDVAN
jgi:hypothetical protein